MYINTFVKSRLHRYVLTLITIRILLKLIDTQQNSKLGNMLLKFHPDECVWIQNINQPTNAIH